MHAYEEASCHGCNSHLARAAHSRRYAEAGQEIALEAIWACQDSMKLRDRLLRPLLEAAVRAGAAPLPLATVRSLEEHERKSEWGGAGAAWADSWEPAAEVHARFHPRFQAAVRTLLLANHRGLPGAGPLDVNRRRSMG